ncbi:hypothetical protein [Coxiella-like endosymbiont of Rhipicephalus sanguineus]|uniref:hypothetical protein n=1 Tax=Coxiella-like endosymbiont of Rhipicephalus sanguineus TaxID=1955402 RepID=UPI002041BE1D|nr:hypothetical protein [Coxiella-like endosymbiont of Rhipicephalus sanguineus]
MNQKILRPFLCVLVWNYYQQLIAFHRGFAEARIVETVTALRPALFDNLPRINWQHGLIAINGLYRHSFLLALGLIK